MRRGKEERQGSTAGEVKLAGDGGKMDVRSSKGKFE